jgi:hypothetical protein
LHACFAAGIAPAAAGIPPTAAAGAAVVPVASLGVFGGGLDPPQPVVPIRMPPTAAAIIELVSFMITLSLSCPYTQPGLGRFIGKRQR